MSASTHIHTSTLTRARAHTQVLCTDLACHFETIGQANATLQQARPPEYPGCPDLMRLCGGLFVFVCALVELGGFGFGAAADVGDQGEVLPLGYS